MQDSVPGGWAVPVVRLARMMLLSGLIVAAYWAGRLAWADHLSRSGELAERERAVQLAPTAAYYERLADKREERGLNPLPDLGRAAALDPENPGRYLRLGLRAEWQGDLQLAEHSLLRAAELSRLYAPRYALAQYYFRRGNADSFWRWSHAALQTAFGDVTPILELCRRMQPDPDRLAQQAISEKPEVARQYLAMLLRHGQTVPALALARHIARAARSEDVAALLGYCNLSLSAGSAEGAVEIWNTLCRRKLLPYVPVDRERGPWLTNPDFAIAPLRSGFDWNLAQAPWLQSNRSGGELRLTFSGRQPEDCLLAWQYVPAARNKRYRLWSAIRSGEGSGAPGLSWIVFDPAGKWSAGEPQADGSLVFQAPSEVVRLALMYRRPAGSTRLEGTVAVTGVTLERVP